MSHQDNTIKKVLRIDASLQPAEQSGSRQLADYLLSRLAAQQVETIDLAQANPPAIDADFLAVAMAGKQAENAAVAQADRWIEQLQQADAIVISTPMYNFGMPAHLKTFFDYILRAGVTFQYTENGPLGLVGNKPVYLLIASGGDYRAGAAAALNHLDGHLKAVLNFIGLTDLHYVHAAGMAAGDAAQIVAQARQSIDGLIA